MSHLVRLPLKQLYLVNHWSIIDQPASISLVIDPPRDLRLRQTKGFANRFELILVGYHGRCH